MADRRYRGRPQDTGDCRAAAGSAEKVGGSADRSHKKIRPGVERYERAAKVAMEIAIKVSDDLLRDAAVRQIVELCLKANDAETARPLFRAIQSKSIIEDVLREHPSLRRVAAWRMSRRDRIGGNNPLISRAAR